MSSSLKTVHNLQSPAEIKKISQHDLPIACSTGVIFGTKPSINQVFNGTILDCNWMLDAEGWDRRVWGVGNWKSPLPLPHHPFLSPHAYFFRKSFLAPTLHSYQIQDGNLISKCELAHLKYTWLNVTKII